jgi:hypothetical protein
MGRVVNRTIPVEKSLINLSGCPEVGNNQGLFSGSSNGSGRPSSHVQIPPGKTGETGVFWASPILARNWIL